ncbi:MAG TPA: YdiU family protein [Acidimicrobiaceae bacterium]|nr:YdiU family protein [Acidimicrobiaceae bacterium]
MPGSTSLDRLRFASRFTDALPADPVAANQRRQVEGACYSRVAPAPAGRPHLLAHSAEVAELLGIDADAVADPRFAEVFAGNLLLAGMDPYAACYGGHQFGNWAGQLGDGRAIALGELTDVDGRPQTLQLKGAGPTPYSRTADGLAVLRSSLREFLCSEAMAHLGVPTTRALCLVGTGDLVMRDMLYDGHPAMEPGAVVCRVAPSFVRFGNFQLAAARGDIATLRRLFDFVVAEHFPELAGAPAPAAALFAEVVRLTADLVVEWLRVGFVHGVLNTDNMSILGLTIDYGPYGWLDDYDPDWTPNTTDAATRRYRFGRQPHVGHWNLVQLANALHPLVDDAEPFQAAVDGYVSQFDDGWRRMTAAKLGLPDGLDDEADLALASQALAVMSVAETDMTIFWRRLADVRTGAGDAAAAASPAGADLDRIAPLRAAHYRPDEVADDQLAAVVDFGRNYAARMRALGVDDDARRAAMNTVNPKYVLRNYLAQLAIDDAGAGDMSLTAELADVLRHPYDEQPQFERHAALRPDWARTRVGCSQLSCSS